MHRFSLVDLVPRVHFLLLVVTSRVLPAHDCLSREVLSTVFSIIGPSDFDLQRHLLPRVHCLPLVDLVPRVHCLPRVDRVLRVFRLATAYCPESVSKLISERNSIVDRLFQHRWYECVSKRLLPAATPSATALAPHAPRASLAPS